MPKNWSSVLQSHSIKIEDFKINPINPFNPNKSSGGVKIKNLLLGISCNMPKMLCFEFQSCSIKIEDICLREWGTEGHREVKTPAILWAWHFGPAKNTPAEIPWYTLYNNSFLQQYMFFNFKGQAKLCDHFLWQLLTSGLAKFIIFLTKN